MYGPLTSLLPRLGAQRLLTLQPALVGKAIAAMDNQAVCGAASGLVMAVLQLLRSELNAGANTELRCRRPLDDEPFLCHLQSYILTCVLITPDRDDNSGDGQCLGRGLMR